ncbi:MAG TPA: HK97-gp10 family putative phage morphogenesis protein [Pyrinomonadaceae bacterium]|jgi:HK97 gp10 family phage protein|nr:HK97-gp10 family putative phage morphogenesis protein [Pyrinomonadaceae bacterium]
MEVTVNVVGLEGVEQTLANAGVKLAKKTIRRGLKAGAETMVAAILPKVPVLVEGTPQRKPGELRDAIKVKYKLSAKEEQGTAIIGPEWKAGDDDQSPGLYGLFVEVGSVHNIAKPYMRPGFDEAHNAALESFTEVVREGVATMNK